MLDLNDKDLCQQTTVVQFGVAKSTVGNINKNRGATLKAWEETSTVIPRLMKIIRFRITFVSRNVISHRFL